MKPEDLIAEALRLDASATPGPWGVVGEGDLPEINDLMIVVVAHQFPDGGDGGAYVCNMDWTDDARNPPDARFVARARSLLPALARLAERQGKALDHACAWLESEGHDTAHLRDGT